MPAADAASFLTFSDADFRRVERLGGKGAGLAQMTAAGLPVPPGFIITTDVCRERQQLGTLPPGFAENLATFVNGLERETGRTFGRGSSPLLVSVRSGAPISMPGMMDTILNLGLNAETARALAAETGDVGFALRVFTRFLRMYAEIVLGASGETIDEAAAPALARADGDASSGGSNDVFEALASACRSALENDCAHAVPEDANEQLLGAIAAVFDSWNSRRAVTYRDHNKISHELGTAIVVQTMVFGNLGSPSGTGVAFSRDPLTGEPVLYGEFLEGGQGEDVVAGTSTPQKIAEAARRHPALFEEFSATARLLEDLVRDVVDIEFTIERGRLYVLQVRSAKRTAAAALRVAADFLREGKFGERDALRSVALAQVRQLARPGFSSDAVTEAKAGGRLLATGIGASPGQSSGRAILDPGRAEVAAQASDNNGMSIVLVRPTTSPHDLHGMLAATGILTSLGGATSHAAVVARALNKPCVVGCAELEIDQSSRRFRFDGTWYDEGAEISIDGASGDIFAGALPVTTGGDVRPEVDHLLDVADRFARCRVFARVATPEQLRAVLSRGATGTTVRLGDALATSGKLQIFIDRLLESPVRFPKRDDVVDMLADLIAPLLVASGSSDFALRAVDLGTGEAAEMLHTVDLFAREPRLALPVGVPELIETQLRGLARAAERTRFEGRLIFTVRHVTDPGEMRELKRIANVALPASLRERVAIGATLTSLRGALTSLEISRHADVLWIEVRSLLATAFGYPSTVMLTADPLDDYLRRGLLGVDPRTTLDEAMTRVFLGVAAASVSNPNCRVGVRLSGAFAEEMIATLYRIGFRSFIVDTDEVRPARFALGKEAAR